MLNRLKDVFRSLREHEVRYVVVGGIAAKKAAGRGVDLEDVRLLELPDDQES